MYLIDLVGLAGLFSSLEMTGIPAPFPLVPCSMFLANFFVVNCS